MDLFATIADVFDAHVDHATHGVSLAPLLDGTTDSVRDWAIGGVWGNWVQVTDGATKYARAPVGDNYPLSAWSNRWSTMPIHIDGVAGLPPPDRRAWLDTMPGTDVPVLRQPFEAGDPLPIWALGHQVDQHHVYRIDVDPDEQENRAGERVEAEMAEVLRTALVDLEAPAEQLDRLGLS